jgi:hypothetical protein
MADDKPKPVPWCGHNLRRILSTVDIWVITKKKQTILGRIVKPDEDREAIDKNCNIQSF